MSKEQKNKYGLSRYIPSDIRRKIRQKAGFGCVVCGCAIYEYEHIEPEFKDAKEHTAKNMTLLCVGCHGRKTKGLLSVDTVKKYMNNPRCLQKGFSFDAFDVGDESIEIFLGTTKWINPLSVIEILGVPILSVEPPEEIGHPFRINALFFDSKGKQIFKITQNEWQGSIENWDIEVIGQRITIRNQPNDIILKLRSQPPGRLYVERLKMFYRGYQIIVKDNDIEMITPEGGLIQINGGNFCGFECEAGFSFTEDGHSFGKKCTRLGGYEEVDGKQIMTNTINFGSGGMTLKSNGYSENDKSLIAITNDLMQSSNFSQAISYYEQFIELHPNISIVWLNYGAALSNSGAYEKAISAYEKVIKIDPDNPDLSIVWMNIGTAYVQLELFEEAVSAFRKFLQINPKNHNSEAWFRLSLVLRRLERYEEVITAYNQLFMSTPEKTQLFTNHWFLLSESLAKLRQWKEAVDAYDKVFTVDLDNLTEHCKGAAFSTQLVVNDSPC